MKIFELFEQTIAPVPAGSGGTLPTTQPTVGSTDQQPNDPNQPPGANQTTTTPPGQPMGQQPNAPISSVTPANSQQQQQVQQGMKATMTDLDKIAAQIVGLKQKQQQMQQQMQQVTPTA
jgi:hypothetical protein